MSKNRLGRNNNILQRAKYIYNKVKYTKKRKDITSINMLKKYVKNNKNTLKLIKTVIVIKMY